MQHPIRKALFASLIVVVGFSSVGSELRADQLPCGCRAGQCRCTRSVKPHSWQVIESRSFRVHHVGQLAVAERLSPLCEKSRQSLQERWLGDAAKESWSPKCDLFLYPSGAEFQRLTRFPADTWGFADLEIGQGQVWMRRLHLRSDDPQKLDKTLVHELTHVVLADYFAEHQIPRWADEGIAVLSEPIERRNELRDWLTKEATQNRLFSWKELASQKQIPRDKRLGDLFYAQSSALIEFLLAKQQLTGSQVLRLVAESEARGLDATLKRWFPEVTRNGLESDWRRWLTVPRAEVQVADDELRKVGGVERSVLLLAD